MAKTTSILIIVLAILAALITGIQIGRKVGKTNPIAQLPSPAQISILSTPISSPLSLLNYSSSDCGVTFSYSPTYQLQEASDSAILTNSQTGDEITLICGTEFPTPPLPPEKIEEATIAGQLATIYHDASAKDGSPLDVVVLTHPQRLLQIALFGFGQSFQQLLNTLTILP